MFNHYLKTGFKPVSTMDRQVDNIHQQLQCVVVQLNHTTQ